VAVLTYIRTPAKSIVTSEQIESIQEISGLKIEKFFQGHTFISGVLDDELGVVGSPLYPQVTNESGGSIDIAISGGAAILRDGSIIILESVLEFTVLSSQVNKTLFINFQEEWSNNITTIQKPTGTIINVSKVQIQAEDIVDWVYYNPTSFIPGTSYSSSIALGMLIVDAGAPHGYTFQVYDAVNELTFRHVYMPVVLFPDKNYNIEPSVDRFCSLYEILACRGGGTREVDNPFGISTRNVENLLASFVAFIKTSGVARADLTYLQISTSSVGDDTITIRAGSGVTNSGKYIGSTSDISQILKKMIILDANGDEFDPVPPLTDDNYYIYLQAIEDNDGYDTYRVVGCKSDVINKNDDLLKLGLIYINESGGTYTIISVTDLRVQLTLHSLAQGEGFTPIYPPTSPGLYILEEELDDVTNKVRVRVRYGDEFTGKWVSSQEVEMIEDHGWVTGDWDDPEIENKEPWYLYDTVYDARYRIVNSVVPSGGGNPYKFILDPETAVTPGDTHSCRIVGKADFAIVKSIESGDDAVKGDVGLFEGEYSDESIWVKGLKPDTSHNLVIEGYLNGFASGVSDPLSHTTIVGKGDFAAVKVYKNLSNNPNDIDPPDSTDILVCYDTVVYDVNSDFDVLNKKFVVPNDGKYLVYAALEVRLINLSGDLRYGNIFLEIFKNAVSITSGSTWVFVDSLPSNTITLRPKVNVFSIDEYEENDEIEIYLMHDINVISGEMQLYKGEGDSYLNIIRLT